jgi:signal transduction histidine kinase/CheY-like chemotaxis protein
LRFERTGSSNETGRDEDHAGQAFIRPGMRLWPRSRLFRKYFAYFLLLVGSALLVSDLTGLYFYYKETRAALFELQREKALGAAVRIEQFAADIERQVGWTTLPLGGGGTLEQRYFELLKLLRQVPAISDASWLDAVGREQVRVSRLTMDRIASGIDRSGEPAFREPAAGHPYFGPVDFLKETEPYMTIALTANRERDGVTQVEVNLKFVWDVVSRIRIGKTGHAYVVDRRGQLISHPDISLVLKKTDFSALPQVGRALAVGAEPDERAQDLGESLDPKGRPVLAAYAPIPELGWIVFVEQPLTEAYAPLYAAVRRTGLLLLVALALAVTASLILARHIAGPIRALQEGAARIGAGALDHRMEVKTGDELQTLAGELNQMAARLRESYAGLERKVAERTRELELANQAKSRFLRAASHDLRQPMHALGLLVSQLDERAGDPETRRIAEQAQTAVTALRELLDAILDISRLDAGVISPEIKDFAIADLLARLGIAFAASAAEKGLRWRVVPSRLWVRSDPLLLERISLNLAANAVRYTRHGGVIIGCRRRGDQVRITVCDTGPGIAPDQQQAIFQEFYQVSDPEGDRRQGLGLGLAIAARLAHLLGCRISVASRPGKGSVFAVEVPRGCKPATPPVGESAAGTNDSLRGACVLVVDDDTLVCAAMQSQLMQWGCEVAVATSRDEAVAALDAFDRLPDALLCDYRLPGAETGIAVIRQLREIARHEIPAALISGDTAPGSLRDAKASGLPLLAKPVAPAKLRALLEHLVSARQPQPHRPNISDQLSSR